MDNLWLLTEERPKPSVILQIIETYCRDFDDDMTKGEEIKIKPIIKNGKFMFTYIIENLGTKKTANIYIKIVSGESSFFDFLVFKQNEPPTEGSATDNLLMAVEETKTSDKESRNTGVYQRGTKFVYISIFYNNVKLYMLYNEELNDSGKKPTQTSIFGTNLLLTMGVTIIGKDTTKWFQPFRSLDELINYKEGMHRPPSGNVPISITQFSDRIEISGRLSKPADKGNIGHDPNIGALSMIAKCVRILGWDKDIVITQHGVTQPYIDKTKGKNKFLYICKLLNLKLQGLKLPATITFPDYYWKYEMTSEKITSIFLHVLGLYYGLCGVYENHAGCERGYFRTKAGELITLPKKDSHGINLYLPDLVLYDQATNYIIIVEGEKLENLDAGIHQLDSFESIEKEYISPQFPGAEIFRCITLFGGNETSYINPLVLIYINSAGNIYTNPGAPECMKRIFSAAGISI